jgi:putative transposase
MKKSRFSDNRILAILKETETGGRVPDLCRTHGMSDAAFYKWLVKFGGMDAEILSKRKAFYETQKSRNPTRWSGETRNWQTMGPVNLNSEKEAA